MTVIEQMVETSLKIEHYDELTEYLALKEKLVNMMGDLIRKYEATALIGEHAVKYAEAYEAYVNLKKDLQHREISLMRKGLIVVPI